MENSLTSLLSSVDSVIIFLPNRPYFDQVAAGLALYLSLQGEKNVTISCPSAMLVEFSRLIGVDRVTPEIGNKNLTIRLANYDANCIEKVSYDIENGEFKLTVVPKPGQEVPQKNQIDCSYSGSTGNSLIILVGGLNESHFPQLVANKFEGSKIIHIGNKSLTSSTDWGIMSFARPASSNSELVADLIEESGLLVNSDIATNLLSGIEEGSKNFSSSEVTAETFQLVANLMKAGGKRVSKERLERKDFPPGVVPGEDFGIPNSPNQPPKDWMEPKIFKGNTQT